MKRKRRTKTTIEKREVYVIRSYARDNSVFCPECAEPVRLISLDEAVRISTISSRAIHRLMEAARVHFFETAEGIALICPATLLPQVPYKERHTLSCQPELADNSVIAKEEL